MHLVVRYGHAEEEVRADRALAEGGTEVVERRNARRAARRAEPTHAAALTRFECASVAATHRSSARITCQRSHRGSTPAFSNAAGSARRKAGREPPLRAIAKASRAASAARQDATMASARTSPTAALDGATSTRARYGAAADEVMMLWFVRLLLRWAVR